MATENDNRNEENMEEKKVDYTTYPEGFNALLKHLDFLPDDIQVRHRFMMGLLDNLGRR
ncbi:hypothetical protein [uncultured Robinsoniella sp.]|uniref:hypothetical protein n=1 Tax=uncultured Robinsoniella sp. TaxID=904190 RepID=UPI00374E414F